MVVTPRRPEVTLTPVPLIPTAIVCCGVRVDGTSRARDIIRADCMSLSAASRPSPSTSTLTCSMDRAKSAEPVTKSRMFKSVIEPVRRNEVETSFIGRLVAGVIEAPGSAMSESGSPKTESPSMSSAVDQSRAGMVPLASWPRFNEIPTPEITPVRVLIPMNEDDRSSARTLTNSRVSVVVSAGVSVATATRPVAMVRPTPSIPIVSGWSGLDEDGTDIEYITSVADCRSPVEETLSSPLPSTSTSMDFLT